MTHTNEDFEKALSTFIEGCFCIHQDHLARLAPNVNPDTFSHTTGKRYVRVIRESIPGSGGSVHCFVDRTNGNVLKAAGWKAPAKHARGNIFDEHNGLGSMDGNGPAYLR